MRRAVFAAMLLLFAAASHARDYPLGIYVTELYNFDYAGQTFCTDFWLWSVYGGAETDFRETIDIVHDLGSSVRIYSSNSAGGERFWMQQKINAQIQCRWDMKRFPFDSADLSILLEDFRDIGDIRFVPDTANSGISPLIDVDGWNVTGFSLSETAVDYGTNFGDMRRTEKEAVYSRVAATVSLTRVRPWVTFFKMTSCVFISLVLSLLPFFMKPETDSRLALPSAALFAVVGNKYVVDSAVPSSAALTLLDSIHSLSLVCILLVCAVIIRTDGMRATHDRNELRRSFVIDRLAACAISLVYVAANTMLVSRAFGFGMTR